MHAITTSLPAPMRIDQSNGARFGSLSPQPGRYSIRTPSAARPTIPSSSVTSPSPRP
jgi:hypothetical protein